MVTQDPPAQALAQLNAWMAVAFVNPHERQGAISQVAGALTAFMRAAQAAAAVASEVRRPPQQEDADNPMQGTQKVAHGAGQVPHGQREPPPEPTKARCGAPPDSAE